MKLTLIRNATLLLDYVGTTFLVDPFFANKGTSSKLPGAPNAHMHSPLIDLPVPLERLLNVDAVIVTHMHADHWDSVAASRLPKHTPLFAQNTADAQAFQARGFTSVRELGSHTTFAGITLCKTPGRHADKASYSSVPIAQILGEVCGVVFKHESEKTLYVAGDTIWNECVSDTLAAHKPEVIVLNAGWMQMDGCGGITMSAEDVEKVHHAAPQATIVAVHMEAISHCLLTRNDLWSYAIQHGFAEVMVIPDNGERMEL